MAEKCAIDNCQVENTGLKLLIIFLCDFHDQFSKVELLPIK